MVQPLLSSRMPSPTRFHPSIVLADELDMMVRLVEEAPKTPAVPPTIAIVGGSGMPAFAAAACPKAVRMLRHAHSSPNLVAEIPRSVPCPQPASP